ncbi:MAG: hypothetical protein VYD39_01705 [Bacteroidota bacterium]|nr:hypothetical protein [Bacteroidota bacterium]
MEPNIEDAVAGKSYQFQRKGYYVVDTDSTHDQIVFNKTVGLRDNWSKNNK